MEWIKTFIKALIKTLRLTLFTSLWLLFVNNSTAEIYKNIDADGRVYFSDRPTPLNKNYTSHGYSSQANTSNQVDNRNLEKIAEGLKNDSLKRQTQRKKEAKQALKKQKQQQKKRVAAKKKKKACALARKKEDKAFRKRSQTKNLKQAESALARYEKQRDLRATKCR